MVQVEARDQRGRPTALVVNAEDKVEQRILQTERTVGNQWLINDGLKSGDRLITEGLQYVKPGDEVSVSEAGNVASGKPEDAPAAGSADGEEE